MRKPGTICLANKETLVVAGELICQLALENRASILPVDSEHSAIWQCLKGEKREDLDRILTCGRDTKYVSLFQSGENPREGKTKLLAVGYYVPEKVLAAIQEFNDSNDDCFIEYKEYEEIVDPDDYLDKDGYTDYDAYGEAVFDYIWKAIGIFIVPILNSVLIEEK